MARVVASKRSSGHSFFSPPSACGALSDTPVNSAAREAYRLLFCVALRRTLCRGRGGCCSQRRGSDGHTLSVPVRYVKKAVLAQNTDTGTCPGIGFCRYSVRGCRGGRRTIRHGREFSRGGPSAAVPSSPSAPSSRSSCRCLGRTATSIRSTPQTDTKRQ